MWLTLCLVLSLLTGDPIAAEPVEVFDTDRGRVVATHQNTEAFQREAGRILESVTGRVVEISPQLEPATIVKIPLSPPRRLSIRAQKLEAEVTQMFVVMPKGSSRPPWLILHTRENDSLFVEFTRRLNDLQRLLSQP